jgi:L-threonylcarbamoyladenylate synthase
VSEGGRSSVPVDPDGAAAFERCVAAGGLAIFPADTVYGLAVDPRAEAAVGRLNALKGRDPAQPSGVMFFALAHAAPVLADLGPATRAACERLLPGPVTLVLPNPSRRFPLACGGDPERLGLRVPALRGRLAPLAAVSRPVLQSSANLHGGPDPARLADVPPAVRAGADLTLDGGDLPGLASTVVDLSGFDADGRFELLREGAVPSSEVTELLSDVR